jgi:hypothetical protein
MCFITSLKGYKKVCYPSSIDFVAVMLLSGCMRKRTQHLKSTALWVAIAAMGLEISQVFPSERQLQDITGHACILLDAI